MIWQNGGGRPWGDLHTSKGVECAQLAAHGSDGNVSSFPRRWTDVKSRQRGDAWFFVPSANPNASCNCTCGKGHDFWSKFLCQDMMCRGPTMEPSSIGKQPESPSAPLRSHCL
jgi:hypothetical protein|eukprot:COSAG01_NODE_9620_length_2387_cov_1.356206_2_plen_113_part_00